MELDGLKQKLLTMASHSETAVNEAVRALVERNYDLAVKVKDNDDVIDQLELEVDEMAIHLLAKAPLAGDLRFVMVAMKISNNLERVGDEATKIAKRARDLNAEPPVKVTALPSSRASVARISARPAPPTTRSTDTRR